SAEDASVLLNNLSNMTPENMLNLLSLVGTSGEVTTPEQTLAGQENAQENAGLNFLNNIRSSLTDTVNSLMGKTMEGTNPVLGQEFAGEAATVDAAEIASLSGKQVTMDMAVNPEQQKQEVLNMLKEVLLGTGNSGTNGEGASALAGQMPNLDSAQLTNLMNALSERLSTLQDKGGAMKLFRETFSQRIAQEWNLEAGDLSEKSVKELYSKLLEQTERVLTQVKANARPDSPVQSTIQNLQNNIHFMNDMNHVFSYIQIPLKNMGQGAQGELYVYSGGKNHFSEDGNISALLHLDMPHLGPMDVYVALTGRTNVNTNFYLADESSLDLIAEHIDELSARLEKKGYTMNAEFVNRTDEKPMMQEIIEDHRDFSVIQSNSFDMRA
nr:flagellar hook-length control protein FliK [Lachnospiraceae bacterium]